nr:ABC transporter substrate-binding protein [Falsirhodobacter sp. alg1]
MKYLMIAAACAAATPAWAEPTHYPLEIENCGTTQIFAAAPERVVTVGQTVTETLFALGLADRVKGTSLWFNSVLPEYAVANAQIPRIADNTPGFEAVIGKRPDLVATQYEWMIGAQGAVGTRDQFADLGVATYIVPADCVGKNNSIGADGTRLGSFSTETIYQSVAELAAIFDVQDKGATLNADLRSREEAAVARAQALNLHDLSAVVWFSSAEVGLDPFVAGQKGIPAFMLTSLGIRNVVTTDEEWPAVGWETIARANPTVIILARMDRRRHAADDIDVKLDFLRTDPVASQMEAVKQNRIVILDAMEMEPSLRLIEGLEKLTAEMEKLAE